MIKTTKKYLETQYFEGLSDNNPADQLLLNQKEDFCQIDKFQFSQGQKKEES